MFSVYITLHTPRKNMKMCPKTTENAVFWQLQGYVSAVNMRGPRTAVTQNSAQVSYFAYFVTPRFFL